MNWAGSLNIPLKKVFQRTIRWYLDNKDWRKPTYRINTEWGDRRWASASCLLPFYFDQKLTVSPVQSLPYYNVRRIYLAMIFERGYQSKRGKDDNKMTAMSLSARNSLIFGTGGHDPRQTTVNKRDYFLNVYKWQ